MTAPLRRPATTMTATTAHRRPATTTASVTTTIALRLRRLDTMSVARLRRRGTISARLLRFSPMTVTVQTESIRA